MKKKIVTVRAAEEDIFRLLDDDLFFGQVDKEMLQEQLSITECQGELQEVDEIVCRALTRALNVTISDGDTIYTKMRKKNQ